MGFLPENQVRTRLPAGGRWIRTIGPRHERAGFCCGKRIAGPNGDSQKGLFLMRYRWFESISLQRRVRWKPDVGRRIPSGQAAEGCGGRSRGGNLRGRRRELIEDLRYDYTRLDAAAMVAGNVWNAGWFLVHR